MHGLGFVTTAFTALVLRIAAPAAQSTSVDFDRDVKPLLRDKCVGCHGPAQQNGGLRLDRRQSALVGGGTGVAILPGNSARSPLVRRISGSSAIFGPQMPPTGPLRAEDIAMLKQWIDEGAHWPEAAATAPAPDTPLMKAALNGSASDMRALLERHADPNARNSAGATALMWAVTDSEKVRLLLDHGADARTRSDDGRTALHIAALRNGSIEVVAQLLAHGASATEKSAGQLPIELAAIAGDAQTVEALLRAGASPNETAAANASFVECVPCLDALRRHGLEAKSLGPALAIAIGMDDVNVVEYLLKSGAAVNDPFPLFADYTPLMIAAYADRQPLDKVALLLGAGADPSATAPNGETAVSLASRKGDRAVVDLLTRARAAHSIDLRAAIEKSIALLQKSDVIFMKNTGCISCHHETLPAMLVAMAGRKQLHVDTATARLQLQRTLAYLDERRERVLQGFDLPGSPATTGYLLMALDAQGQRPTPATDALVRMLKMTQLADGRWRIQAQRPPIESSDITATAVSLRGLTLYAPSAGREEYERSATAGVRWLEAARPISTEEKTFRLLGLTWGGAKKDMIAAAADDLAGGQRADGGWSELTTLESDAYSTGQALFALHEAGAAAADDPVYQRGTGFLVKTQREDGSWLVKSRTIPFQVYFETGFPHGPDQFISAAGTSWAAIALTLAVR